MTLNFYVSYLVPVEPERIAEIEKQIAHVIATVEPPDEAERQVARLQRQMEPEKRREPANMRTFGSGALTVWACPRCVGEVEVARVYDGTPLIKPRCPFCGAEVYKEELPMSLDLFRMRTRRTDGVEVAGKPQA